MRQLSTSEMPFYFYEGFRRSKRIKKFMYVESEQRQFEGDHYKNDHTIDRPVFSVYLALDSMEQLIKDVDYMNSVFSVVNTDGKSILKEKFNPKLLKN